MNARTPRIMKSTARAASGGVIVMMALIALMFFRGTGTGDGEEKGDGEASVKPQMATTSSPENVPEAVTETTADGGLTPDEQKAMSGKILGILIDDWDYLLEIPGDTQSIYRPMELDRLITLAKQADGDSNGIRVRILQRESARPKAERELRSRLSEIGIGSDAIYMPAEFIP